MKLSVISYQPSEFSFTRPVLVKLVFSLFLFLIFFTCSSPVFAYDLTITCGDSSCTKDVSSPLFSPTDIWYPGFTTSRTIHFINTTGDTRSLSVAALNSAQTGDIDTVMQFTMQESGSSSILWSNTLRTLYTTSAIGLPNLSSNGTFTLQLTNAMNSSAGNEFQTKTTTFDLTFTISGIEESVVVQTVSNNSTSSTSSTGDSGTGGSIVINPITRLTTVLPRFFFPANPNIAGTATENPPEPEIVELDEGNVSGATTCQSCTWWQLLLLQILLTMWFYRKEKQKNNKKFWMGGAFIGLLTYAVFLFINRSCRNGWELWIASSNMWCHYFIVWVFLIFNACTYAFWPKEKNTDEPSDHPSKP